MKRPECPWCRDGRGPMVRRDQVSDYWSTLRRARDALRDGTWLAAALDAIAFWVISHGRGAPANLFTDRTILALIGPSLIIVKLEDHDVRAPILRMGREVALSRRIPVLVITSVAGPWRGER